MKRNLRTEAAVCLLSSVALANPSAAYVPSFRSTRPHRKARISSRATRWPGTKSLSTTSVSMSTLDEPIVKPSVPSNPTDDNHDIIKLHGNTTSSNIFSSDSNITNFEDKLNIPPLLQKIVDKVGKIDDDRIIGFPQYLNGDVPKLYSNIEYKTFQQNDGNSTLTILKASPASKTLVSSAALLTGTALGAGILALPTATYPAGFLPTTVTTFVAWSYMTISALLTSELLINRYGETGKVRNVGLLELYDSYLGDKLGKAASVGFLLVSYVMVVTYLSEGGDALASSIHGLFDIVEVSSGVSALSTDSLGSVIGIENALSRTILASFMGMSLLAASRFGAVQKTMTNLLVPATLLAFVACTAAASTTADFQALVALPNQHPEVVLNAFPILFMSWAYHGVIPRVVYDLEGDSRKITKAIVGGSTSALLIFLIWNAVALGNVVGNDSFTGGNPLVALHDQPIGPLLSVFSQLAAVTSLTGVVLGLVNEFYDAIGAIPSRSFGPIEDNKWKVALLTLLPPTLMAIALGYYTSNEGDAISSITSDAFQQGPMITYQILEYTGAFGASILFLILPALMAWQNRYGDDARPLTVKPMFPLGKLALGSMYKAAGTLIVEQGLEKLGVFEFIKEHLMNR